MAERLEWADDDFGQVVSLGRHTLGTVEQIAPRQWMWWVHECGACVASGTATCASKAKKAVETWASPS